MEEEGGGPSSPERGVGRKGGYSVTLKHSSGETASPARIKVQKCTCTGWPTTTNFLYNVEPPMKDTLDNGQIQKNSYKDEVSNPQLPTPEESLSIKDKMLGSNMFQFHCRQSKFVTKVVQLLFNSGCARIH